MATQSKRRLDYLQMVLSDTALTTVAYEHFKKITPINKGNARRNTTMSNNRISANYPYASRLDDGYSKQAPNGMVEPTWAYLKEYIRKKTG